MLMEILTRLETVPDTEGKRCAFFNDVCTSAEQIPGFNTIRRGQCISFQTSEPLKTTTDLHVTFHARNVLLIISCNRLLDNGRLCSVYLSSIKRKEDIQISTFIFVSVIQHLQIYSFYLDYISNNNKMSNTKSGQVNLQSADGLMQGSAPKSHDLKTSIAGIAGNVIEWYDFSVYGYFSDIIGKNFFPPNASGNSALVESFAVFGVAFLVRPLGGLIFGHMGDNVGRKSALENSILLMAFPTFALGCLPTYASVGWWSTALLILCRMLQGFSVGGQLMSSMVFTLEASDEMRWGFQAATVMAATTLGGVIGSLFAYTLRENLTEEQMLSFGWRIPFFFGLVGLIPGLYLKVCS